MRTVPDLLLHGGIVYRLSKDYRTAEEKVVSGVGGSHGESPAMFKKDGTYFFLFSNLTSWEKNDNFYFTACLLYTSDAADEL